MISRINELVRALPSVSALLESQEAKALLESFPRAAVVASLRNAVSDARAALLGGVAGRAPDADELLSRAEADLRRQFARSPRRVINATGIILHTGLGRAPLSQEAIQAVVEGCSGYCDLELDLNTGMRGRRAARVTAQLVSLTGAEAAAVVNNNAAATLLILQTLARDREVVVSRGELIEIGGSFRLPDIMRLSGANLREVGTTNRTRLSDYESAISDSTAVLMKVHTSNYRVVGFAQSVAISEIAELAHRFGLVAVHDLGSGALIDFAAFGLPDEPHVRCSLKAGADLVCFSGDKLLGGPQCGIILGQGPLVARILGNPLMRTYRVDKLTLAALEATLRCYSDPDHALSSIPALAMMRASTEEMAARAQRLCERMEKALADERFLVCSGVTYVGGGSMPGRELPTIILQWRPANAPVEQMINRLREYEVPVIARASGDAVCFDLRTVRESDFDAIVAAVAHSVRRGLPSCAPDTREHEAP